MPDETADQRYARDIGVQPAERKSRNWDSQTEGRKERRFVHYTTRVPAGESTGGTQGE